MYECSSFSLGAANPDCRAAVYWNAAWMILLGAAAIVALVAFLKRPRRRG